MTMELHKKKIMILMSYCEVDREIIPDHKQLQIIQFFIGHARIVTAMAACKGF